MLANFFYNQKSLKTIESSELKEASKKKNSFLWIKCSNPSHEETEVIKNVFDIHPTTIEDITSTQTRIKYEEFEEYTLIVFKSMKEIKENTIETYNISFIAGENFIISINENHCETIEELCKHFKKIEHLLKKGEDHILHFILDKEVDRYLKIKSEMGEDLKQIEREFMESQSKDTLKKIFSKELVLLELRQLSESITDLCLNLTKPVDNYVDNELIPYFRDIYDHTFKTTEGYKSMLGRMNGMKNMYASITSMKTNEVMRALTIIMALMMPLTLITGFYGMNVKLPLQNNPYAYLVTIVLMISTGIFMVWLLRKRGWNLKD